MTDPVSFSFPRLLDRTEDLGFQGLLCESCVRFAKFISVHSSLETFAKFTQPKETKGPPEGHRIPVTQKKAPNQ